MVVCGNDQILLYDTCNMAEYDYFKFKMREKDVKTHVKKECGLNEIFNAFVIDDDCLEHSDNYWKNLVPGGDLLEAHVLEPEEGYYVGATECAMTRLDIQPDSVVFINSVPLVHVLPLGAVRAWLKFVGRKFSAISRDDKNEHTPFCTEVN
jgi:hypothetical protein